MNIFKVLLTFFSPLIIFAQTQYTPGEVLEHNTPQDCWVIFEDSVYDLTEYLPDHDVFMDIRVWCGKDMTEDFETKAGIGRDHKPFSYAMLEDYHIGEVIYFGPLVETPSPEIEMPYNLFVPLLLTLVLYWGSYFIFKKKNILKFNGFWNTVLLLTFLVPSFGFGIFMMLRYNFPELRDINFEFMYWHVELSVVMGAIALSHFIQRIRQYLVQLKK